MILEENLIDEINLSHEKRTLLILLIKRFIERDNLVKSIKERTDWARRIRVHFDPTEIVSVTSIISAQALFTNVNWIAKEIKANFRNEEVKHLIDWAKNNSSNLKYLFVEDINEIDDLP